jgi:hypothetical protein
MSERGYPVDDFDTRAAELSVDHPHVVEHYRAAHRVSRAHGEGEVDTEELRRGTVHYRELFEVLVGSGAAAETTESRGHPEDDGRPAAQPGRS